VAAKARHSETGTGNLPIELRAGLDFIVLRTEDPEGRPTGNAIGLPRLVEEWRRYGLSENGPQSLIALGATPDALRAAVVELAPQWVVTLQAGPFAKLLRPLRASVVDVPEGLSPAVWREHGYHLNWSAGFFGFGTVAWALAELTFRRAGRPDLADRCRLGMLRSLKTSSIGRLLAMNQIRAYVRDKP
jgi:hypothetical protein